MDHPAVQEAVLMGWVMVMATLGQDFKATRPDMAIKAVRATRADIIIRGVNKNNNRVIRVFREVE